MDMKDYDDLVRQGKITKTEAEAMHKAGFTAGEAILNMAMLNVHERDAADWGEEDKAKKETESRDALLKRTSTNTPSKAPKGMSQFYTGGKNR